MVSVNQRVDMGGSGLLYVLFMFGFMFPASAGYLQESVGTFCAICMGSGGSHLSAFGTRSPEHCGIYYDVWEVQINEVQAQYCQYYRYMWFSWHELEARVMWFLSLRVAVMGF